MDHYRCVKCYLPSTGGIRDTEQVPFPKISTKNMLLQSATDILAVLQSPPPSLISTINYGDDAKNAIDHLACLLQRAVQRTKPQTPLKPLPLLPHQPGDRSIPSASPPRVPPHASVPRVPSVLPNPAPYSSRQPIAAAAANVSQPSITFANPYPSNTKHAAIAHFLAQDLFSVPKANHIYNPTTGKLSRPSIPLLQVPQHQSGIEHLVMNSAVLPMVLVNRWYQHHCIHP